MKRLILCGLFCLCAAGVFAQRVGSTMYVQVNAAKLKSGTGFFAGTVATLEYGTPVVIKAVSGKKWAQVSAAGKTGWVAQASLTTKKIVKKGSGAAATDKEIALAGKGFSQEVENVYKSEGSYNYTAVDAMEKVNPTEAELKAFIDEGRLATGE